MEKEFLIKDIEEKYDLELKRVIDEIKKTKAKIVLLQFADGLKSYAVPVVDYLKGIFKDRVEFLIWLETCYGACDMPVGIDKTKPQVDLVVQFGHNEKMPGY
jgi:2-(3-amino-3-carboxypropyl)histidine synthase